MKREKTNLCAGSGHELPSRRPKCDPKPGQPLSISGDQLNTKTLGALHLPAKPSYK